MATRAPTLRREEAAGLVIALAAHAALVTWLALKPPAPAPLPAPERMTVTFSDEVALQSTSPKPAAEAAPAVAPVLAPDPVPEPAPEPKVEPRPAPPPVAKVQPKPVPPKPAAVVKPTPQPKPVAQPKPAPQPKALAKAQPAPVKPAPVKSTPTPAKPAPARAAPAVKSGGGGTRVTDDFLNGLPGGQNPAARDTTPPAQAIGPAVQSAIRGAIARQLKPHWTVPQGVDAEQLVTILRFRLARDGTLMGTPEVVGHLGVTSANQAQVRRHEEQAIRAVRLAAPFELPVEYYSSWQVVTSNFDKRLSQ